MLFLPDAQRFLAALGSDLRWRLIRADDETGRWHESARDLGRTLNTLRLDGLADRLSWHVRPMPAAGRYWLTLLDDATDATVKRLIADGLPPTAVLQTSPGRLQVWHRWPWALPQDKATRLVRHLQTTYGTDPGANSAGHPGRLPGSRNWKPGRQGVRVVLRTTGPALTAAQAQAWLAHHPLPADPLSGTRGPRSRPSSPPTGIDSAAYQAWLAQELPRLRALWRTTYQRTDDASRADFAVAIRAVSLQLSDAEAMAELRALITPVRARKHRPVERYLAYTVAKARRLTGVMAPGVFIGGQFDPDRVPWAKSTETRAGIRHSTANATP